MKSFKVTHFLLLFLLLQSSSAFAQQLTRPFAIEIHIGDSIYKAGTKFRASANGPSIRVVFNRIDSESDYFVKKVSFSSNRNVGSSQTIASFDVKKEDQSNGFSLAGGVSPSNLSLTYTLEGITEVRNGTSKTLKIPLKERCFTIQYY